MLETPSPIDLSHTTAPRARNAGLCPSGSRETAMRIGTKEGVSASAGGGGAPVEAGVERLEDVSMRV